MNYGKIIINEKNKIKKNIKSKKELIRKNKEAINYAINKYIEENKEYNINNLDVLISNIEVIKCSITNLKKSIETLDKKYADLLLLLYSDNDIDKLTDDITNFIYEVSTEEIKNKYKDNFDCKEEITDMLFADSQKVIDLLISYDNLSQEDISKRDILINNIIFIFNVNK